jgi:glycosyltransferase involved in cell wall biosynthesis
MSKPCVSFVIPVLNAERDIKRCLTSINNLQCEEGAYEVIVLDNGSTDCTQQVVREMGFVCQVIPEVKVGALRNHGAAIARGDYLAFIDADVELMPRWLLNGLTAFDHTHVVASGCFPKAPPNATWVQRAWEIQQRGGQGSRSVTPVPWLPSMNLLVRREAFLSVGGFDEQLTTAEDVDLCYRLGKVGTILSNSDMEAIHWGEAPDLRTFWRKEVWRGIGNLKGVLSHGLRWDELPSLGYPLYMLGMILLFGATSLLGMWQGKMALVSLNLGLLTLPALLLAMQTSHRTRQFSACPKLFLLYLLYGLARAYSLIKASSLWRR